MAFKTWAANTMLTASDVNTYLTQNMWVQKPSTESVTSSTTLQNDNDFSFSVAANTKYWIKGLLSIDGASTAGWKAGWSLPAGCTMRWATFAAADPSVGFTAVEFAAYTESTTNALAATVGGGQYHPVFLRGILVTGGTAGTAVLQWAQNSSNATATVIEGLRSMVVFRRIV